MRIVIKTNIPQIAVHFTEALENLPPLFQRALDETGKEGVAALADAAPLGTGRYYGGHLKDSFEERLESMSMQIITTQAVKLRWVRKGTGVEGPLAHMITPRVKRAMWWVDEPYSAPHPMFAVRGQHPNDFVTPVLRDIVQYAEVQLNDFADQLAAILAGKG